MKVPVSARGVGTSMTAVDRIFDLRLVCGWPENIVRVFRPGFRRPFVDFRRHAYVYVDWRQVGGRSRTANDRLRPVERTHDEPAVAPNALRRRSAAVVRPDALVVRIQSTAPSTIIACTKNRSVALKRACHYQFFQRLLVIGCFRVFLSKYDI